MASGVAEGAKAGAAFGPWGAAIGGAAGLVGDLAADGGGPMVSGGGVFDLRGWMDGSGWTVSTGSSNAAGGARTQSGDPWGAPAGTGVSQAGYGASLGPWGALGLTAVAAFVLWKWVL